MSCCHYEEGYEEGLADGKRGRTGDCSLSDIVREWAALCHDDGLRDAAFQVADAIGGTDIDYLVNRIEQSRLRLLTAYKAACSVPTAADAASTKGATP